MQLIVDASVALKWVIDESDSEQAVAVQRFALFAPELLFAECSNALWKAVRRKEVSAASVDRKIDYLTRVSMTVVPARMLARRSLAIAIELEHPAYDTLYMALGENLGMRVVTADARLLRKVASSALSHLTISLQDAAAN